MSTELEQLRRDVEMLKRRHAEPIGDRAGFSAAQSRADSAYRSIGDSAPAPMSGETLIPYRQRLLAGVQHLSPQWRDIPMHGMCDSALTAIEMQVFESAEREARHPTSYRPGELRAIHDSDITGRRTTRYVGDPNACWAQFNPPIKYARDGLQSFRTPNGQRPS